MPTDAPTMCHKCHKATNGKCCTMQRTQAQRLYHLAAWQQLREYALSENPVCVDCLQAGRTTAANEVHHITAHRGQMELFLNINNVMCLCCSCHSIRTNRGE